MERTGEKEQQDSEEQSARKPSNVNEVTSAVREDCDTEVPLEGSSGLARPMGGGQRKTTLQ